MTQEEQGVLGRYQFWKVENEEGEAERRACTSCGCGGGCKCSIGCGGGCDRGCGCKAAVWPAQIWMT